jgi:Mg-chelatase subunit ChlD
MQRGFSMDTFSNWVADIQALLRHAPQQGNEVAQILFLQSVIYDATKAAEMIAREMERSSYGGTDD